MTGNSVIVGAMRLIGVIGEGETPSASESADALTALNAMLDSWNNDRKKLYQQIVTPFALTTATQAYTLGAGGTMNMAWPVKIDGAICVVGDAGGTPATNKVRIPLDLLLDAAQWAALRSQTAQNTFPEKVFIDKGFPLRNVKFWPVPTFTGTAPLFELWSWTILAAFPDLVTTITLPPGYEMAIKSNLAIILAPEYGRRASNEVLLTARDALNGIADDPSSLPSMLLAAQQPGGGQAQAAPAQ